MARQTTVSRYLCGDRLPVIAEVRRYRQRHATADDQEAEKNGGRGGGRRRKRDTDGF